MHKKLLQLTLTLMDSEQVIGRTKKWIIEVVIGCNFCPFAANVVKHQTIFYKVEENTEMETCLASFVHEMERRRLEKWMHRCMPI